MRFATFLLLVFTPFALSAEPRPVDLVVRHGTVVTVDATRRVIPDGAVAVEGGRIVGVGTAADIRSEEHTSELQSHLNLVCRLLLEKKKIKYNRFSVVFWAHSERFVGLSLQRLVGCSFEGPTWCEA